TGTPDVGIGTGIGFSTTSLAGTVLGGSLAIEATDVTASDEEFDFVVNLTKGGTPTEALRVKGSTANAITLYQVNAGSPYSLTGASTNRTIDLSGYTMDQLANLVCTLIEDIKQLNLLV